MGALLVFCMWVGLEIFATAEVGRHLGGARTLALFFLTSLLGLALLRSGGLVMLTRVAHWVQQARAGGAVGVPPVAASVPRLACGLLLIIPGFATDVLGLLLWLSPLRLLLQRKVARLVEEAAKAQRAGQRQSFVYGVPPGEGPLIIEGEIVDRRPGPSPVQSDPPQLSGGES